jgi:two-component system OmpR family response regulator
VKILTVDDDPRIREVLTIALERAGFQVITANDGQSALRNARRDNPDLIVLDVGLPEMDGLEVCRKLRASSDVPILFLTARDDEVDRIIGLELGADDYVTKPFSPRELVARIKAILKRSAAPSSPMQRALECGAIRLDRARHECSVSGQAVSLTATEMAMLARLMQAPDLVVSRVQLVNAVYGAHSPVSDRTVDSHLRNLRAKLAEALGGEDPVETLHGVGLRMKQWRDA